jgi:hypothetical protein
MKLPVPVTASVVVVVTVAVQVLLPVLTAKGLCIPTQPPLPT